MDTPTWKDFRKGLMNELDRPAAQAAFDGARTTHPALSCFKSPQEVVEWLLERLGVPDEEDEVLRAIKTLATSGEEESSAWLATLALGLWPVLEWVFCRVRPRCNTDYETASEIWTALQDCFAEDAFWKKPRIAKRLMSRVWCRAARAAQAEVDEAKRLRKLARILPELDENETGGWVPFLDGMRDETRAGPSREELVDLAYLLVNTFGLSEADADLVVRHAVAGVSLADIARERGVSCAMLRQRYGRARKRLRVSLSKSDENSVTFSALREMGKWEHDEDRPQKGPGRPLLN